MSTQEQEVIDPGDDESRIETALVPVTTMSVSTRVEIDMQIATAKRWPRQPTTAAKAIHNLATMNEETAKGCMFALPRGNKPITGPSIRFAEIVAQVWGNNRVSASLIDIDRRNKLVVAEGTFHDLENNHATRATVNRRIVKTDGGIYNDDMIIVTGNAGDGKTAFIQQIERKVSSGLEQRANGSAFVLNGRRFLTNYDGSQDEETKANDEVLQEFLKP